jgi:dethiobiotin synthetase
MNARFITATGTGVGKTLVTAALIRQLRARGERVRALKPLVTGYSQENASTSDPAILIEALGLVPSEASIAAISPLRFRQPLAPAMAAAAEGRALDFDALIAFCRSAHVAGETLLIEGVGGVMVPLVGRRTVLDWIVALEYRVILVTGSYLGTLSHTLTALDVLERRAVPLAGIVVCESENTGIDLAQTANAIGAFTPAPVHAIPRISGAQPWTRTPDLTSLARPLRPRL